jgi:hypothetical protein
MFCLPNVDFSQHRFSSKQSLDKTPCFVYQMLTLVNIGFHLNKV